MRQGIEAQYIHNAKQATGVGISILVSSFRHKELTLATAGMGVGDTITVKIQGSSSASAPTFSSAKSASNLWDYIQIVDLEDGTTVDGDTGVTFSDSNDVRKFAINADGLVWVNVEITVISDAVNTSLTAIIEIFND